MRYISHYEEYPIYEPAEGGYYYPGNHLVASERESKRGISIKIILNRSEKKWLNGAKNGNISISSGVFS